LGIIDEKVSRKEESYKTSAIDGKKSRRVRRRTEGDICKKEISTRRSVYQGGLDSAK